MIINTPLFLKLSQHVDYNTSPGIDGGPALPSISFTKRKKKIIIRPKKHSDPLLNERDKRPEEINNDSIGYI